MCRNQEGLGIVLHKACSHDVAGTVFGTDFVLEHWKVLEEYPRMKLRVSSFESVFGASTIFGNTKKLGAF